MVGTTRSAISLRRKPCTSAATIFSAASAAACRPPHCVALRAPGRPCRTDECLQPRAPPGSMSRGTAMSIITIGLCFRSRAIVFRLLAAEDGMRRCGRADDNVCLLQDAASLSSNETGVAPNFCANSSTRERRAIHDLDVDWRRPSSGNARPVRSSCRRRSAELPVRPDLPAPSARAQPKRKEPKLPMSRSPFPSGRAWKP